LRHFANLGVLEDPRTAEYFERAGLVAASGFGG
jgi:hypothetical protein